MKGRTALSHKQGQVAIATIGDALFVAASAPVETSKGWPRVRTLISETVPALERADALRRIVREYGLTKLPATWVLTQADYTEHLLPLPQVPESEVRSALYWALADVLPYSIEEATFDYVLPPPTFRQLPKAMVRVVAVPTKTVLHHLESLKAARLVPLACDIDFMSYRYFLKLSYLADTAALLIMSGAEATLLVMSSGYVMFHRKILLHTMDTVGRSEKLANELERSLNYYQNNLRQVLPAALLYVGAEQPDTEILQEACDQISIQLQVILLTNWLGEDTVLTPEQLPILATLLNDGSKRGGG